MLPHHTVRGAESPHAHLFSHRLPRQHHRVQAEGVIGVGTVEAEGLEVVQHQVALRLLVKLELDHLRPVLGAPEFHDLHERVDGHAAFAALGHEVLVCRRTDHELDFGVELSLSWRIKRNRKFRGDEIFDGRRGMVKGIWDELGEVVGLFRCKSKSSEIKL